MPAPYLSMTPNLFAASAFVFSIAMGWVALYLLFWLFPTRSLVPRPVPSTRASTADTAYQPPRTFWTMAFPTLRISTTRFTRFLALPRHVRWVGRLFYLLGALVTLTFLGFLGARLFLEGVNILVDTSSWVGDMGDLPSDAILGDDDDLFGEFDAPPFLTIPGINLPSSLWRPFVIAVFGSLLFRELGHSLAASAWNLPTHSISFYIHLIFPSASVNFSNARLRSASPLSRLAIAAAGIWHNILLALVCMALIARPWLWLSLSGFAEVPGDLRGVLVISAEPPLDVILPPYSRLVAVNDHPVTSSADLAQLALEVVPPLRQCLVPSVFPMSASDSDPSSAPIPLAPCCLPPASNPASATDAPESHNWLCFFHPSTLASACISPTDVSAYQCAGDRDCPVGFCMASHLPHDPRARLLDLNVTAPGSAPSPRPDQQQRVLWMGNPEDLARRVRVGRVVSTGAAAGALLPDWWPYSVVSVLELTVQASLSLAVVNAVPVGPLDGRELVVAIVAVLVQAWRAVVAGDTGAEEGGRGRREEGEGPRDQDPAGGSAASVRGSGLDSPETVVTTGPPRPKLRPRYLSSNFAPARDTSDLLGIRRSDMLPVPGLPLRRQPSPQSLDRADTLTIAFTDLDPHCYPPREPFASMSPKPTLVHNLPLARHDTLPLVEDQPHGRPSPFAFCQHETLPLALDDRSADDCVDSNPLHSDTHGTTGALDPCRSSHFCSAMARHGPGPEQASGSWSSTTARPSLHSADTARASLSHQHAVQHHRRTWTEMLHRLPTLPLPDPDSCLDDVVATQGSGGLAHSVSSHFTDRNPQGWSTEPADCRYKVSQ